MDLNKKQIRKILMIITFTICLFFAINNLGLIWKVIASFLGIIKPFILGGGIAFIINIPMSVYQRKLGKFKGGNILSLLLAYLSFILVIVLVIYIVTPQLIQTAQAIPSTIQYAMDNLNRWIEENPWLSTQIGDIFTELQFDWMSLLNQLKNVIFSGAGTMINSTIGVATSVATNTMNVFIGFVFSIYILIQKESLAVQIKKVLYAFIPEKKVDVILEIGTLTKDTFSNFFTGQCTEAVILTCLYLIAMTLLNFPYAMVISVLVGCLSLIPVIGAFIACIFGMILIVMVNPIQSILFLIMFVVIQNLEGNLIYPRVVGNSIGLPSMWVLIAITLGASLMGILGIIIFIPLTSIIYTLLKKLVYRNLEKKKIDMNKIVPEENDNDDNKDNE